MVEELNVNLIMTIEAVDSAMIARKDSLHKRLKVKSGLVEDKKANAGAFRDQIKVVDEELQYEMGIIDALASRKLELSAGKLLGDVKDTKDAPSKVQ